MNLDQFQGEGHNLVQNIPPYSKIIFSLLAPMAM